VASSDRGIDNIFQSISTTLRKRQRFLSVADRDRHEHSFQAHIVVERAGNNPLLRFTPQHLNFDLEILLIVGQ
jgi:hypothetical protein